MGLDLASNRLIGRDRAAGSPRQPSMAAAHSAGLPVRPRLPGWLVVGAAGRNAGKTEFVCAIIEEFRRAHPIVGVKVTAIVEGETTCPRGGDGCGACVTLQGDFQISEEMGDNPGKDTARMLTSGAQRVFWVRCRRQRIHAAIASLLARLDPRALVVAESNSLAQAIEPDLFLMVRNAHSAFVKPTAAAVMPLARRVVASADGAFDLSPHQLAVVDGAWHLAEASAAILAGGKSSRMGQDKSLLPVAGAPLIRRIYEQLASRFDEPPWARPSRPRQTRGRGPPRFPAPIAASHPFLWMRVADEAPAVCARYGHTPGQGAGPEPYWLTGFPSFS